MTYCSSGYVLLVFLTGRQRTSSLDLLGTRLFSLINLGFRTIECLRCSVGWGVQVHAKLFLNAACLAAVQTSVYSWSA